MPTLLLAWFHLSPVVRLFRLGLIDLFSFVTSMFEPVLQCRTIPHPPPLYQKAPVGGVEKFTVIILLYMRLAKLLEVEICPHKS